MNCLRSNRFIFFALLSVSFVGVAFGQDAVEPPTTGDTSGGGSIIMDTLDDLAVKIVDSFRLLGVKIYQTILFGFLTIFESLPNVEFLDNINVPTLPSGVLFFTSAFNMSEGVAIITGAYLIRFFIRRIPIIG